MNAHVVREVISSIGTLKVCMSGADQTAFEAYRDDVPASRVCESHFHPKTMHIYNALNLHFLEAREALEDALRQ